jgi:hypothetical protein
MLKGGRGRIKEKESASTSKANIRKRYAYNFTTKNVFN